MNEEFSNWKYVVDELQKRYGFNEEHAENAANRLNHVPELFNDFLSYLRTNQMPATTVAGHTVSELIERYEMLPIGAYLILFELSIDPVKGEEILAQIKEEGHRSPKYDSEGNLVEIEFSTLDADNEVPGCPKCGKPATWIEQYKRWYCYECKEYI